MKPQLLTPASSLLQPQGQPVSIAEALRIAAVQIDKNQFVQAERILAQVLSKIPNQAEALHLMGIMAHKKGNTPLGVELIGKALKSQPGNPLFHANIGEMYRLLKRVGEAVMHGELAVSFEPNQAAYHSNLGIAFYDKGAIDQAEVCQQRALELYPELLAALNNMGSIQRDKKNREAAIGFFRKVLEIDPQYLEALNNLGSVLVETEAPDEALTYLIKSIQINPGYADAHHNIGNAFFLKEDFDKALYGYRMALELAPGHSGAMLGVARTLKEQEHFDEAHAAINQALKTFPEKPEAWSIRGEILSKLEQHEIARESFRQALHLNSALSSAYLGLGQIQMELGEIDAAQETFQHVIDIDPGDITPHVFLAQAKKVKPGDASLLRLEAEAQKIETLFPAKALAIHFALGKSYDDIGDYDKAFKHFAEGCRLKRSRILYDPENQDKIVRNIMTFFTRETIDRLRGAGCTSDVPIFVLGMPRSGTTLIETILASHPDVFGAGELRDLLALAAQPKFDEPSEGYPLSIYGLTKADFTQLGKRYVAGLQARAPAARYITDKMPANFLAIGLIHLMLPNAKIVHIKRNPVDICLSGFTQLFNNSQHHSYDLQEMGRYYVNYAKMMEHWREVLPTNAFFEIQYEELVADKANQARSLVEYCGLSWNDACLDPHKTERSVRTASITQVRQPVYTSSVERWRRYEKHLQPLLSMLGEHVPVN